MKKNIQINSPIISSLQEKITPLKFDSQNTKNEISKNTILQYIDILEKFKFAKNISLKKGDILFDEWDTDKNIYFIKKWLLSVEKYTNNLKNFSKQLAILKRWDFLWEWWIGWKYKKEVLIKALENTEIIWIDAEYHLKIFIKENPEVWYDILRAIIIKSNERLLEANKIITSSFEIERYINEMKKIDLKNIFKLIDHIKNIVWVDYLLFFEKHRVLENYLILKYDSRIPWKIQDVIFEKKWYFIDLDELLKETNIKKDDNIIINKLSIWSEVYWYLIFWKEKKSFNDIDKKVFSSISNSLSWILKKFIEDKENLNKIYISESKTNY